MMNFFHIFGSKTKRRGKYSSELQNEKAQIEKFSFSQLKTATENFNTSLKIEYSGHGSVYKGSIRPPHGRGKALVVAIKILDRYFYQGREEWLEEVGILAFVEHPNLVKLIGYCSEDGEQGLHRLLVYEYMPNKSLESHLFSKSLPPIRWSKRLQILLGAAQGLAYLHEGLENQVIFRDFNPANVLLDDNFNPKLSDFEFKRIKEDPLQVARMSIGYRYADPEYVQTGYFTSKSDSWSFGIVLYEILSGRKAIDRHPPRTVEKFMEWVKHFPADSKRFQMIMDPRLNNQYALSAARKVAKLGENCFLQKPKDRPTMSQIVEVLQEAIRESEDEIRSSVPNSST